jgi:hypothetical protein
VNIGLLVDEESKADDTKGKLNNICSLYVYQTSRNNHLAINEINTMHIVFGEILLLSLLSGNYVLQCTVFSTLPTCQFVI